MGHAGKGAEAEKDDRRYVPLSRPTGEFLSNKRVEVAL